MTVIADEHPGLYVHIPFCRSRCGYCTFISGEYDKDIADRYIQALHAEYKAHQIFSSSYTPSTVFLGGGTPSMLSASQLDTLLTGLPTAIEESTCEVNPDSISQEKLQILADHGITRLSIGVQTFSPKGLRLLGRSHDSTTACKAVDMAHKAGFENISIDLIYCWPEQQLEMIKKDIIISISLKILHLSYYAMILEPSCRNYATLFTQMSRYKDTEEREKRSWDFIEQELENNGFIHYETSNYALSDFKCQHNVNTWRGGEYLGLGLSAHSHISGRRFANTDDINLYLDKSGNPSDVEVMSEYLTGEEKAKECAVFWLRLFEGIEAKQFTRRTGFSLEELYGDTLLELIQEGFLEWDGSLQYLRVPKHHQAVLDSVLVELV